MAVKNLITLSVLLFSITSLAQVPDAPAPRFLSKSNIVELSAVGAALAADAISTQAVFGWRNAARLELNPAIPHSRIGTSAYFLASFAADGAFVFITRRHPMIHRIVNIGYVGVESWLAVRNYNTVHFEQRSEAACLAGGPFSTRFQRCPR